MDWIAKIINGQPDEFVHAKLLKYGIGEHPGPRAKLTFTSSKMTFKADLDLEKVLTRAYLASTRGTKHKVSGVIISYDDPKQRFTGVQLPLEWSQSKGVGASVFKAKVKETVPHDHLEELLERGDGPTTFFLLSLVPTDVSLASKVTTKSSFPKAPAGSDEEDDSKEKDPTFTKGTIVRTPEVDNLLFNEVLPDVKAKIGPKTKNVSIHHTIVIDDIQAHEDPTLSVSEKRRLAKKRGKLVRTVTVDGTEYKSSYPFNV
ncbi:MAG: hypothetical protein HXY34_03890 [Candidatus Thorarchaeota archaeon]|nr:hypothetical protein [Candidatus Thorarchaeota archaeon]